MVSRGVGNVAEPKFMTLVDLQALRSYVDTQDNGVVADLDATEAALQAADTALDGRVDALEADHADDVGWTNLTLLNSWTVSAGQTAQYMIDGNYTSIRGRVTGGSGIIAQLPAPARPNGQQWDYATRDGTTAATGAMVVNTTGDITPSASLATPNIDCVFPRS